MAGFMLEIVTPDRKFFEEEVDMVIVRGVEGDLGILKGRAPLVTPLDIGKIKIKQDGKIRIAAIAGGYVEVGNEKTTIISDAAEWPEEIDIDRAKGAKQRAEERLKRRDNIDVARAEIALRKAVNRIRVAEEKE
ncbi:ATP synthase epsilon chain ATP synthase F1 sector epsilon subunit [Proteiniborus sp. DW1]|uniref:F0F1 ATP synthase subunit epsilon n=1 Tax=Proteiniborus sp. DW1 TaxID=1889883 RepID=UPI00092E0C9A|nr:F0F1 ATP synthase subunit epsilon [Proteiniborus sp. DW1]SCG81865.1 ATP synthase epsilon chain ATP synthase F1 sector epsilon subunit [Proteiniborus sp. DW1]